MFVVITTILLLLIIFIIGRLHQDANVEAIRTSRVIIVGYIPNESCHNAIVECKAMNGRIIRLIDKDMKLQYAMFSLTTEPVWIHYHIEQDWFLFLDFDIYIDGFSRDAPYDNI